MQHLLTHGKNTTYLHSMFGGLFVMNAPMADMVEFVQNNQGIVQYLWNENEKSVPVMMDHIDLIFDWKEIWYRNYNEEFFNQLRVDWQC